MKYLLHFHGNSGHTIAPQCYFNTYVACRVNFCTQGKEVIVFLTRLSTFAGMEAGRPKWLNGWVGWVSGLVGGWLERSVLLTTFVIVTCYEHACYKCT